MVVDFLKSIRESYSLSQVQIEEKLQSISVEIVETNKFIDLLASETESSFTQFTPRNVTNKNAKKMDELNDKLVELNQEKESLQQELDEVNSWLSDIDASLEEVYATSKVVPTKEVVIDKNQLSAVSLDGSSKTASSISGDSVNPASLKDQILKIVDYLPVDPMRARVELLDLVKHF